MTKQAARKRNVEKPRSTDNAHKSAEDAALVARITEAVKAANEAEKIAETARTELVSRSKQVGLLLLEAKKLHPAVKDFEAFLKRVDGLKLSRAYDCMRIAGGRTTDEELRKEARDRKRKSRASKKPLPATPSPNKPEPLKLSVTTPDVTGSVKRIADKYIAEDGGPPRTKESAEISIEQRRAENADLDLSAEEKAAKWSASNLREFEYACKTYLPRLNEADLKKAHAFVTLDQWRSKTEAA